MRRYWAILCWVVAAGLLVGCSLIRPTPPAPTAQVPIASPSLPASVPSTTPAMVAPVSTPAPESLTIWLPKFLDAESTTPGGTVLADSLQAFSQAHQSIPITALPKRPAGKGGLLDFLQTASLVADRVVPDVMVLSTDDLEQAAHDGLLQPFTALSTTLTSDLYPAARQLGTVNGVFLGVVFALDCQHLAYDADRVQAPPATWTEVVSATLPYVFPAGDSHHLIASLEHYLSAGGRLVDDSGQPFLDRDILTSVLAFYAAGRDAGVIPLSITKLNTLEDSWQSLRSGSAGLAEIQASRFLTGRTQAENLRFAISPGQTGPVSPLASGWALVVPARQTAHQSMAFELVEYLSRPEILGPWLRSAGQLPGRRAALATWPTTDPYTPFANGLLSLAQPQPPAAVLQAVGQPIQQAITSVLVDRVSPERAAAVAVEAVKHR